MSLTDYENYTVTKRCHETTPFYAYKIEFVLNNLDLNSKEKQAVIKKLEGKLTKTSNHNVNANDIWNWIDKALPTSAQQKFEEHRHQDVLAFKQATDPSYKLNQYFNDDRNIINENANKDHRVYNTQRDLIAGSASRAIGLKMLPPLVAKAHLRGEIHWHDLDYSPVLPETNCSLPDFKDMLANGFKIGNAKLASPKSIQVAVNQVSMIIETIGGLQYGGQSFNRADEVLATYAKLNYDKHLREAEKWIPADQQDAFAKDRTKKDIYDAMQSLEYNINTMFTTQGQTPFVTINFGLGKSWIEREIQKAILNIRIEGLGKEHRTAVFPKLVFTLKQGLNLNPKDPNYDIKQLAIQCSTKRMYPDVLMYDQIKKITGSFKSPMGCRSFLQSWTNPETGRDEEDGRMNLGVVSVNLPRIAIEAHKNKNLFWQIFHERMNICHMALKYRIKRVKEAKPENAPLLYMEGAFGERLKSGDSVDELFKNSRATVSLGYIGIYETVAAFYGPTWEHNKEAHDFAVSITHKLHELCTKWETEEGYHYSLYSTPAEKLTDTFCEDDIKKFGKIDNITDKGFYMNSFHYDTRKKPTPFEKLTFEEDFPYDAAGGFIHYCEYPNLRQNPKALEAVWDWAYNHIGYLGTNTDIDHCYKCGFKGQFTATARGFVCPQCGNHDPATCDVVKRVCGYLGNPGIRGWNKGRNLELMSRRKHMSPGMIDNVANFEKTKQMDTRIENFEQHDINQHI